MLIWPVRAWSPTFQYILYCQDPQILKPKNKIKVKKSFLLSNFKVLINIRPAETRRNNALKKLISNSKFHENSLLFDVLKEKPVEHLISRNAVWKIVEMVQDFDPIMEWKISWERESVFNNEWISGPSK